MTRLYLFKVIVPAFAGMNFVDVRRRHVTALLDKVEDERGARTADAVLSTISTICKWYAHRDENYETPIISGMRRQKKQGRDRVLRDHELVALWKEDGLFGNFTKLALLTAQRKEKISDMRWADVVDGVWHIRAGEREKGTGEALPLPQMALDVLDAQRQAVEFDCPYVFKPAVGGGLRSKLGRAKGKFEAKVPLPQWQLHDLRRTARSLMAAAGVPDLVAELVLGHKQQGVASIYNRHEYLNEKGDALGKLAGAIRDIVEPAPDNVQKLMSVRRRGIM
jgi:integrase